MPILELLHCDHSWFEHTFIVSFESITQGYDGLMSNQIETEIDVTLTDRNRMTAFFRIILVVPAAIFVASFTSDFSSASWSTAGLLVLPPLLALVFRGVYPSYALSLNESLLGLQTRVNTYLLLLTDEYPSIEENEIVSITLPEIGNGETMSRGLPLVKWFLAIPLYIVGLIYIIYAFLLTLLGWFSILFTGTYPERCAEGVVGTIAYWNRIAGYALVLVTDEYPTFSL